MGIKQSVSTGDTLAEGYHSKVFYLSHDHVIKRGRTPSLHPNAHGVLARQLRFFAFIDTIADPAIRACFARCREFSVTRNSQFTHIPRSFLLYQQRPINELSEERKLWLAEEKEQIDKVNKWPFVYAFSMDNKGHRIDKSRLFDNAVFAGIATLLKVLYFLQQNDIIFTDMHFGNVLVDDDGNLAIVDYADMYMPSDPDYDDYAREHEMMVNFIGMCIDIEDDCYLEETTRTLQFPPLERARLLLANETLKGLLTTTCARVGYKEPIKRLMEDAENATFPFAFLLNVAKLRFPSEFRGAMSYSHNQKLHSWLPYEDVIMMFENVDNLPTLINHFEKKVIKAD